MLVSLRRGLADDGDSMLMNVGETAGTGRAHGEPQPPELAPAIPTCTTRQAGPRAREGSAREPRLILADEPTGNRDSVRGREIMQLLSSTAHERNAAVLLVTHDLAAPGDRRPQLRAAKWQAHMTATDRPDLRSRGLMGTRTCSPTCVATGCAVAYRAQMSNGLAGYHYDYADSFTAPRAAVDDRTPEQWARAVFEDAPRPVRWLLANGFRYGLGLRLDRGASPEHVLGWAIIDRSPDSITVESRSWLLTSRLVFATETTRLTQSTYVRYDRPIAKIIWPPVSILHRQIVPRIVRHAATRGRAPLP